MLVRHNGGNGKDISKVLGIKTIYHFESRPLKRIIIYYTLKQGLGASRFKVKINLIKWLEK